MLSLPRGRLAVIKSSAKQRGIAFVEADADELQATLTGGCHHCSYLPALGAPLNGLDRVDSGGSYSAANCVACCTVCNMMKHASSQAALVASVRAVCR
jgi:hypothetical protein